MSNAFDESLEALLTTDQEPQPWDPLAETQFDRLLEMLSFTNLPGVVEEGTTFQSFEQRISDIDDQANPEAIWGDAYITLVRAAAIDFSTDPDGSADNPMTAELRDSALTLVFVSPFAAEDKMEFAYLTDDYLEGVLRPITDDKEPIEIVDTIHGIVEHCVMRRRQKNRNDAFGRLLARNLSVIYRSQQGLHDDIDSMMDKLVQAGASMIELMADNRSTEEIATFIEASFGRNRKFQQLQTYLDTDFQGAMMLTGVAAKRLLSYGYRPLPAYESKSSS